MGAVEKRARQKEEFRREILESARELFISDGYENFSLRKLAKKIEYSPTTLYLYFKNKDDLLRAISEEFFAQFLEELKPIRSVSADPMETLRRACLHLVEFGLKNPKQYELIFFKGPVYGTREEFLKNDSMAKNTYLVFKEMVKECIKVGRLSQIDVDVIVSSMATVSHGIFAAALYTDLMDGKTDIIVRTVVDALLKGYQK
ncbi:MAG: HTH-type transcriptional regulator AcrR [Syntrophorhabdaceae bacterium PtaU1.Bin034]|nr:MAG: HTH-type transcriptional regulator AcrR [Syntrophorhabdaceae bacterium PtaU1.Bin034]